MPASFNLSEPELLRIRQAYFSDDFLRQWNSLTDRDKYIWVLGLLAELEHGLGAIRSQLERVKLALSELKPDWEE